MRPNLLCPLALFIVLTIAAGAAQAPGDREIALGKALLGDIERLYAPLRDPVVSDYVQGLVNRLIGGAGLDIRLTVRLVESRDSMAAALPGGFLAIGSGAIARAGAESELAGLIAHLVAHLAATPPLESDRPAVFVGVRPGGLCARFESEGAAPAAFRQSLAERERAADALAAEYLRGAGYDPAGMAAFFEHYQESPRPAATGDSAAFREAKERIGKITSRLAEKRQPSLRREGRE